MKSGKPSRGRGRTAWYVIGGLLLFYLVASFFLGENGVFRDVKLRRERAELREEVERLRTDNAALKDEVEALKNDPEHIERLAREQGLVKQGEIVYQYEEEQGR